MNRQELKFDAKNKMREAAVNPYVVTLIMGVILMVLSGVQFILDFWGNIIGTGSSVNTGEASTYIVSSLVFFVIYLVISTILQFGYSSYCLKVANRDGSMSYGDLFSSVRYLLKAIGLTLMISVFVLLWCILLVIPGIIAAYRYSQAIFIMVEDPNKGIMQCDGRPQDGILYPGALFLLLDAARRRYLRSSVYLCISVYDGYICQLLQPTEAGFRGL